MADKPRKNRRVRVEQVSSEVPKAAAPPAGAVLVWLKDQASKLKSASLWALRVAAVGVLVLGGVRGGRWVEAYVKRSPTFALKVVEVSGAGRLNTADIMAAAGLAEGDNIFQTPPERAQAALEAHPWIAEAEVERRLPDHIAISVREHLAVAAIVVDQLYLVADDGSVFKPLEAGDPTDLPVITGVDPESFTNDRAVRARVLVSAVALLHDYRDAGLWRREPIAEIHVESGGGLSIYVGKNATYVRLGERPFRKKLRRFRRVLDSLRRQQVEAEYVYLDNARRPDRVAVRLR